MNERWKLQLTHDGVVLLTQPIIVAEGSGAIGLVQAVVTFKQPNEAWPYDSRHQFVPWHDLEEIAAWVRGDGTDAQRAALADGILEGRRR